MPHRVVLTLLLALVLVPACGGDGDEGPPDEAPFPPTETGAVPEGAFEEGDEVIVRLEAADGSSASGTATLTADGTGRTRVVVEVQGAGDESRADIGRGTCAEPTGVAFPIGELEDGRAETLSDLSLESMLAGEFTVAVTPAAAEPEGEAEARELGDVIACGPVSADGD